jgi:ABC-type uncharacterized transport system permease subunit
MTRRLALEEGVFAGIWTGAVIVTLAVDTGFTYMSVSPYADL